MAIQSVKQTWGDIKEWVYIGLAAILAFNLWGFFAKIGKAAESGAGAVLDGVTQASEEKADKAKAKAANGGKTDFTTEQVARFRQDAEALANYLGRGKGFGMVDIVKDQQSAFSLIKNDYSRLMLNNNKPFKMGYPVGHITSSRPLPVSQNVEDKNSVKRAINWRVLIPFYKDYCGHDLNSDFRYYVTNPGMTKYFKWIL